MKIGLITTSEKYSSLSALNGSYRDALRERHRVETLHFSGSFVEDDVQALYRDCDVILYASSKLRRYKRNCDRPTIFLGYAWMDHGAGINIFLSRDWFRKSDAITFASHASLCKFQKVYGKSAEAFLLPCFTSLSPESDHISEDEIRRKHNLPTQGKMLIYFGRICPEKNVEALISLLGRLHDQNCFLVIVGKFSEISTYGFFPHNHLEFKTHLQSLFAANRDRVFHLSGLSREDLFSLVSASYLSLNLSLCMEENFGLSSVESMALGIPTVATRWGGLKDIISHGETGLLVEVKLTESLSPTIDVNFAAGLVDEILANPDRRRVMAEQCLKRAADLFSPAAFARRFEDIAGKLLKNSTIERCNGVSLEPAQWISDIYSVCLNNRSTDRIYVDNPRLFDYLYDCYC